MLLTQVIYLSILYILFKSTLERVSLGAFTLVWYKLRPHLNLPEVNHPKFSKINKYVIKYSIHLCNYSVHKHLLERFIYNIERFVLKMSTKICWLFVKSIIIGSQGVLLETKLHELHNINGNELLKPQLRTPPTITDTPFKLLNI